ncbi:MAG TPA: hypothetical protein VNK46_08150 [Nitrospiraceae bacterium]|jgi:hypothetical protein|nr:hypothetical protein [Nitrospiraceae bacterium]
MTSASSFTSSWEQARSLLYRIAPEFYELEPGGALVLDLGSEGWILEVTPDGRLICQNGLAMEDIQRLMSDGTTEDLGTDELAKQAKYYLQPAVAKCRAFLLGAGFQEETEMTNQYVAVIFHKTMDLQKLDDLKEMVLWCRRQFA